MSIFHTLPNMHTRPLSLYLFIFFFNESFMSSSFCVLFICYLSVCADPAFLAFGHSVSNRRNLANASCIYLSMICLIYCVSSSLENQIFKHHIVTEAILLSPIFSDNHIGCNYMQKHYLYIR